MNQVANDAAVAKVIGSALSRRNGTRLLALLRQEGVQAHYICFHSGPQVSRAIQIHIQVEEREVSLELQNPASFISRLGIGNALSILYAPSILKQSRQGDIAKILSTSIGNKGQLLQSFFEYQAVASAAAASTWKVANEAVFALASTGKLPDPCSMPMAPSSLQNVLRRYESDSMSRVQNIISNLPPQMQEDLRSLRGSYFYKMPEQERRLIAEKLESLPGIAIDVLAAPRLKESVAPAF